MINTRESSSLSFVGERYNTALKDRLTLKTELSELIFNLDKTSILNASKIRPLSKSLSSFIENPLEAEQIRQKQKMLRSAIGKEGWLRRQLSDKPKSAEIIRPEIPAWQRYEEKLQAVTSVQDGSVKIPADEKQIPENLPQVDRRGQDLTKAVSEKGRNRFWKPARAALATAAFVAGFLGNPERASSPAPEIKPQIQAAASLPPLPQSHSIHQTVIPITISAILPVPELPQIELKSLAVTPAEKPAAPKEPEVIPVAAPFGKRQEFLAKEILPLTRECNLPDALVAGQWAQESGREFDSPSNNYFGLGPRMRFKNIQEGVKTYCNTIKDILGKKGRDVNSMKDSVEILTGLQTGNPRYEGDEANPLAYVRTVSSIGEFQFYDKLEKANASKA